ncbi:MAG: WXG100 family type VII secretion target [Clostridiales bacterium]|nr:WXG100 family type VII secretion target [Clostridiales bacterium]
MPDMSNVDSDKILSAVGQLDGITDSIQGCVGKIADSVETLDKGWVSSVKAEFMTRYQRDWEAMQEMLAQYREISAQLREAAQDFDKTESELLSRVSALG